MREFEFESWDGGRLTVNTAFAGVLRQNGLTTFASLMEFDQGTIAKNVRSDRVTVRLELADGAGARRFFIKRHTPPPWGEYVKPLLHGKWPLLGARPEWEALLRFHQAGLPTMIPAALGECGRRSFLLTEALEGCRKLAGASVQQSGSRDLCRRVAETAGAMHRAGLHHQDFYLGHLLQPEGPDAKTIYVIDLGRARHRPRLVERWIVKDLAQLNYSAGALSASDRLRFLKHYLGRPLAPADRRLIRRIARKTTAIARHTRRHGL